MAITYFGECNSDGSILGVPAGYDALGGSGSFASNINSTHTCPGSGTQNIKSLALYAKFANTPSAGNIRLALYDTSWNLICQFDAEVLVENASVSWIEKVTANLTGTLTLTGGTQYHIVVTGDNNNSQAGYNSGSSGDWKYTSATEYTDGFPATISEPSSAFDGKYVVRVGVEAAGSASASPSVGSLGLSGIASHNDRGIFIPTEINV